MKLFSWHISHHYSYELHHLNVIFTTYTCDVYWKRENSHRYFSSEYRPYCVVSIGRPVKTIAFSSHIILILCLLGLPILTKNPHHWSQKWNLQQYKKLARQKGIHLPSCPWSDFLCLYLLERPKLRKVN